MKKIYVILAVAALTLCAASCGNKNAKPAEEAVKEEAAKVAEPVKADPTVADAAKEAAEDVAKAAITTGAEAVKDAIKK